LFFRQILYRDLGCASYLVGDDGEAAVIDPRWDIDVYLKLAQAERLQIMHVIDTHDHADHVSGRTRLALATGARSHGAGTWDDEHEDAIVQGQELAVGALRLRALGTPGHRPEHLALTVTDLSRGSEPWLVLTGDSLLVGDLARPDLVVEAEDGARTLRSSLRTLVELGDHVEVWPAHVGGSLCGGAGLSGKTSSTIGFERRHNPLLLMDEQEFVDELVCDLPPRPPNVERIVSLNQARTRERPRAPESVPASMIAELLRSGVTVLDGRMPPEFDAGHLAGAINLPVSSPGVGTRAGWVLEVEQPIVVVGDSPEAAVAMATALHAVGLWQTVGYALADSDGWEREALPVARADSWDLERLAGGLRSQAVELVDVRDTSEWITGHVPGSHHLPLHQLRPGHPLDIPDRGRTTAVACAAGIRAAFAASLLRRAGRADVVRVAGGGVGDLGARGIGLAVGAF
jgi:hydroxyacylglutathione hydrolase